jgi:hypothetical protein
MTVKYMKGHARRGNTQLLLIYAYRFAYVPIALNVSITLHGHLHGGGAPVSKLCGHLCHGVLQPRLQ